MSSRFSKKPGRKPQSVTRQEDKGNAIAEALERGLKMGSKFNVRAYRQGKPAICKKSAVVIGPPIPPPTCPNVEGQTLTADWTIVVPDDPSYNWTSGSNPLPEFSTGIWRQTYTGPGAFSELVLQFSWDWQNCLWQISATYDYGFESSVWNMPVTLMPEGLPPYWARNLDNVLGTGTCFVEIYN